jgi:hypothetical protein
MFDFFNQVWIVVIIFVIINEYQILLYKQNIKTF